MMLYSGLEFDGSWQVDRRNGIVALLNMAVDCRLGNRQVVGMDSVKDMLSGTNSIGNNLFVLIELLFVQRNSFAGFNQNGFIFGLSILGYINSPRIDAVAMTALSASIADERRLHKQRAGFVCFDESVPVYRCVLSDFS